MHVCKMISISCQSASFDNSFPTELNGVNLAGSSYERPCVRREMYDFFNTNKRADLEVLVFFARMLLGMLTKYFRLSIFIRILNVLDLHFQGQLFKSSTLASS